MPFIDTNRLSNESGRVKEGWLQSRGCELKTNQDLCSEWCTGPLCLKTVVQVSYLYYYNEKVQRNVNNKIVNAYMALVPMSSLSDGLAAAYSSPRTLVTPSGTCP